MVPNLEVRPLQKGHEKDLRGREMMNGKEKKKKQGPLPQIYIGILDFSLI